MSRERFLAALPPATRARLDRIDWQAEVDSSNAVLLREAATLPTRAVLMVDGQTAGRGRRGRVWQSPTGAHLYLSLFARIARPLSTLGGLSLALGIACAEALRAAGLEAVGLKWPNDLLAERRKLGGLLLELAGEQQGRVAVVAGLGLNLAMPLEQQPEQPWIDVATLGGDPDRFDWAGRMSAALLDAIDRFERDGAVPSLARWPQVDALAGCELRVLAADGEHHGRSLGIADDGALRLATVDGEQRFHSADVSLRPA